MATDMKTNETAKDNLCLLKTVVHSWSDLTLNTVNYKMQCEDEKNSISAAAVLQKSIAIILCSLAILY